MTFLQKASRADVRFHADSLFHHPIRRIAGRLYLLLPGQGVCQRPDRQHQKLLSTHLFEGDWGQALRHLVPVLAFLLGIYIAECVHRHFKRMEKVHWRQLIILAEIVLLAAVGFLPETLNTTANAVVSFVRHAGTDLPQGAGPRLRQHHVYRQYAQAVRRRCAPTSIRGIRKYSTRR